MLLFSFLMIPFMLVSYCMYYKNKDVVPVITIGLVSGILVCAFKTFFLFAHRVVPYSLSDNFIYLLVRQTVLPVLILYLLFFVFSKDSLEYKREAYFPLELSFYSVFLPYLIVSSSEGLYSAYSLFVKPFAFGGMLIMTAILVRWALITFAAKKIYFTVIFVLIAFVYMFVPPLLESMYLIKEQALLSVILSFLYFLIPFGLMVLKGLKKINL